MAITELLRAFQTNEDENNQTHWYVLHAEANAILKTAKSNHNCKDACHIGLCSV